MNNSAQSIKDKLKKIAKENNIEFNTIMRFYMYDRFIEKLSKSKYKDNFVLKGGFYISKLFGINNRSTMDIDTLIRNIALNQNKIIEIIEEIIKEDSKEKVRFNIENISPILLEDKYGGLRVTLKFQLENISDIFHIDIVTGKCYSVESYRYETLIEKEIYTLYSYSLEAILSEKIETILSKLEETSRMKDYYDIYLIYKMKYNMIDGNKLRCAMAKTFNEREFNDDLISRINMIENSNILKVKWEKYSSRTNYTKGIDYEEIINCLKGFIIKLFST